MPDPADYSDSESWMAACIPTMIDEGKPQDEAVAACSSMWENRGKAVDQTVTRAYSLLTVKAVEEDQRTIRGVATTPETDRIGDIVEPLGIKFKNPLPLLLHHRHDQPVGNAVFDKATDKGITFSAKIPKLSEPGTLKDRLDEAWQSIKAGLIAGVSIGFKPRDWEPLENGGIRFLKSEVYELSLVTIPANASATISVIKSLDAEQTAASGQHVPANRPGASGKRTPVSLKLKERNAMKTIAEQISALEAARAAKHARMEEVLQKSVDEGRSTDDAEQEEFDTLEREVEQIDGDLKRFRVLEKTMVAKATPVDAGKVKTVDDGAAVRGGGSVRVVGPKLPPGIRFTRVAKCKALAKLDGIDVVRIAEGLYGDDQAIVNIVKAAVSAGTTTDATWAGALVSDEGGVFADFLEFLRPMTLLGRFGTGNIPALRQVPFRVPLGSQTTGGAGYWTGEGQAKGLTRYDTARTTLEPLKVAAIAVVTEELLRAAALSAEIWLRDQLAASVAERIDTDFIDPDKAAVAGISPASITNGVTPVASSGTDGDAVRADINALFAPFDAANNPASSAVLVMRTSTARTLSLMTNALGGQEFPGMSVRGGELAGYPVLVSDYVGQAGSPLSTHVWLVNARDIYFGDDGGISVDMSREASLQMDSVPTMASGSSASPSVPTATASVSLWQTNSVGFRAERTLNWAKARAEAVQGLSGVLWA